MNTFRPGDLVTDRLAPDRLGIVLDLSPAGVPRRCRPRWGREGPRVLVRWLQSPARRDELDHPIGMVPDILRKVSR